MSLETERKAIFAERLHSAALAKYGKEHGMASKLAADIGVSIQSASKWLRGDVMPKDHYWGVVSAKLNVPTQWLIGNSHEQPEALANVPDASLEVASQAASIVFPLATRLKPDIEQALLDELFRHAYHQLKAGHSVRSVSGEIASMLI